MTVRHAEPSANDALAVLLQAKLPGSEVRSEDTGVIVGQAGKKPDIVIITPGRSPVVIEAEWLPANTVESDAKERLGQHITIAPRPIEAVVALRYPEAVREAHDLSAALTDAALSYCVFTEGDDEQPLHRFPGSGWLEDGSVDDLTDLIRLVSVPQRAVDRAVNAMERGIGVVAGELNAMADLRPGITADIARLLGMSDLDQTRRMACAIIINAMIFHDHIAGMHPTVRPLRTVFAPQVADPQASVLEAWRHILTINYWPIFAIAEDLVAQLTAQDAAVILSRSHRAAGEVTATGVTNAHDLTGRIFQRLIADRKYLATFYTLPASAALLARLAVARLEGVEWGSADAVGDLRIGDFACGTGALLSAVYEQIAVRHEQAGGNLKTLHPVMMEEVLRGCDVMPSAIHITGSTLSGAQASVGYKESQLYPLLYGRQNDGDVRIGSLELLRSYEAQSLLNVNVPTLRIGSTGTEASHQLYTGDFPHAGFDLVIMNPPFTSNTKHYNAGDGVQNAAFAAFDTTVADQDEMSARLRKLVKDIGSGGVYHSGCYHGHAGLGSAFADLAGRKVRPNGVIALVLPFTAINGASWAKFRELIATRYTDITIVSIAANGKDMSFSFDTGIAECLVIARKMSQNKKPDLRAKFISLHSRPADFVSAAELAKLMTTDTTLRRLEDGPYGGVPLYLGGVRVGEVLDAPLDNYEDGWGAARIADAAVAQTAYSLSAGKLWLPGTREAFSLPMALLNQVGQRGLDSQLFISAAHHGPFDLFPADATATYPALWNHNAANETRMVCTPDSQLIVKQGMEERAGEVWTTASRAHVNRDFRFNSQPLTAAITERVSIGGRAWPNVTFTDARLDYAFALWCNSTLGLLLYWWHANKQQTGRGITTIRALESLPVLDFRALNRTQLQTAQGIFNDFRNVDLKPAYLADIDDNRALLDWCVVCDMLGFDETTYNAVRSLAAKWCAEPSVHGGKKRPATR